MYSRPTVLYGFLHAPFGFFSGTQLDHMSFASIGIEYFRRVLRFQREPRPCRILIFRKRDTAGSRIFAPTERGTRGPAKSSVRCNTSGTPRYSDQSMHDRSVLLYQPAFA